MKLNEYEKGFLEAAIDFEGCLTIRKIKNPRYTYGYEISPMCYISNTNKKLLEKTQSILGDGSIVIHQKYRNDKNWKPCYNYQFSRKTMKQILPQLNLVEKEKNRLLVIEALKLIEQKINIGYKKITKEKFDKLSKMVEIIKTLNNRGLNANWNKEKKQ